LKGRRFRHATWLLRFLNYLRKNPGAGFIIAFQVLLIYTAVLVSLGDLAQANVMAIRAYYALVIGVLWMLVDYIREEGKGANARRESK